MDDIRLQEQLRPLIERASSVLVEANESRFFADVQNLLFTDLQRADWPALRHVLGWLSPDDLDNVTIPKRGKAAFRRWGKTARPVMPVWDGATPIGLWVIKPGETIYLPLTNDRSGTTGLPLCRLDNPMTVVVDDPVDALRLTCWSITSRTRPLAFVHPDQDYNQSDVTGGQVVWWSPVKDILWGLRALSLGQGRYVGDELSADGGPPCDGNYRTFELTVDRLSDQPARQLARQMVDRSDEVIRGALASVRLDQLAGQQLLSAADGQDRARLKHLMGEDSNSQISIDGKTIVREGDRLIYDGQTVSEAFLHIDSLTAVGEEGEAVVCGAVHFDGQTLPFRTELSQMRQNTGEWLQRLIISRTARICQVHSRWGKRLLEIANAFHQPQAILQGDRCGWSNGCLTTSRFVIDNRGISPAALDLPGCSIDFPLPLSQLEQQELQCGNFRRLCVQLLGNLLRSSRDFPAIGLYLTGEKHVLPLMAEQFGSSGCSRVIASELPLMRTQPLPTVASNLPAEAADGGFNLLVNVDSPTGRVLDIRGGWMRASVEGVVRPTAWRAVLLALPKALRSWQGDPSQVFAQAATSLGKEFETEGRAVQQEADRATSDLCQRLIYLADSNRLYEADETGVEIRWKDVQAYTSGSSIDLPPIKDVRTALAASRTLRECPNACWRVEMADWLLYRSYAIS